MLQHPLDRNRNISLLNKEKFLKRKDLIFTGRTLFGAMPPKGQEMDDHYFGVIPERVLGFMEKFNEELWKLGISAKTQHNELHQLSMRLLQFMIRTTLLLTIIS